MPQPTDIKLRTQSRVLDVLFDDGSHFELPFEYLRVFSPSAEVTGHGVGEGILQSARKMWDQRRGARGQLRAALEVRRRARHGLYSWPLLHELGRRRESNWNRYLERCAAAGIVRGTGS